MVICYSDLYHLAYVSAIIKLKMLLASSSERREQAMLLPVDERERIRRAYHIERKSIRQIARETGHCRDAIRRAIDEGPPETTVSQYPEPRPSPIFGPFQARIDVLLRQNDQLPQKQRYTSHKIFEIIQAAGYDGCESRVRQYIAEWKHAHQQKEVFLPLEFEPGQDAQCDWVRRVGAYEIPV
jgi:hypothetical protein